MIQNFISKPSAKCTELKVSYYKKLFDYYSILKINLLGSEIFSIIKHLVKY